MFRDKSLKIKIKTLIQYFKKLIVDTAKEIPMYKDLLPHSSELHHFKF